MPTPSTARPSWAPAIVHVEAAATEGAMRELRYAATEGLGLRATGHTASDQVETVLYRIVSSGSTRGIKVRREDGVVRPLLGITREETTAYCAEHGLPVRVDATNADTTRGLIRDEILPLLRRLASGRGREPARARRGAAAPAARARGVARRAARLAGRHEGGRSRRRRSRRARVRHAAARGLGRVGAVDARGRPRRSRGAGTAAGGSSGRTPQEGAGSPRGREGAESGARELAGGRLRRRGGRGAGDRRRARLGRRRHGPEGGP